MKKKIITFFSIITVFLIVVAGSLSFKAEGTVEVSYTKKGATNAISHIEPNTVTFDDANSKFIVPSEVTEFTFWDQKGKSMPYYFKYKLEDGTWSKSENPKYLELKELFNNKIKEKNYPAILYRTDYDSSNYRVKFEIPTLEGYKITIHKISHNLYFDSLTSEINLEKLTIDKDDFYIRLRIEDPSNDMFINKTIKIALKYKKESTKISSIHSAPLGTNISNLVAKVTAISNLDTSGGIVKYHQVHVQDETGGILLYNVNRALLENIQVGDVIQIDGTKEEFNGLSQLQRVELKKVTQTLEITPKEITDPETDFSPNLQSTLVTFTGKIKERFLAMENDTNYEFILDNGKSIFIRTLRTDVLNPKYVEVIRQKLAKYPEGIKVKVTAPLGYYKPENSEAKYTVSLYDETQIELVTNYTDDEKLNFALNAQLFPAVIDENAKIEKVSEFLGVNLTYQSSEPTVINNDLQIIKENLANAKKVIITITGEINGVTKQRTQELLLNTDLTIEQVKNQTIGSKVVAVGVVTDIHELAGGVLFYISDNTGAILIYQVQPKLVRKITVGDKVKFTGELDEFYGVKQLKNVTNVEKVSSENTFETLVITNHNTLNDHKNTSKHAKVTGTIKDKITQTYYEENGRKKDFLFRIYLETEGYVNIKITNPDKVDSMDRALLDEKLVGLLPGAKLEIEGPITLFKNKGQITVTHEKQVKVLFKPVTYDDLEKEINTAKEFLKTVEKTNLEANQIFKNGKYLNEVAYNELQALIEASQLLITNKEQDQNVVDEATNNLNLKYIETLAQQFEVPNYDALNAKIKELEDFLKTVTKTNQNKKDIKKKGKYLNETLFTELETLINDSKQLINKEKNQEVINKKVELLTQKLSNALKESFEVILSQVLQEKINLAKEFLKSVTKTDKKNTEIKEKGKYLDSKKYQELETLVNQANEKLTAGTATEEEINNLIQTLESSLESNQKLSFEITENKKTINNSQIVIITLSSLAFVLLITIALVFKFRKNRIKK